MRWGRAARDGAIVGALASLAFLVAHMIVIEPIWRATPRALGWGAASGAVFGVVLARLAEREPELRGLRGGLLFGALVAATLVPFAYAGWMRARGAPDPFWLLVLALLLAAIYWSSLAAQRATTGWRRLELFAALLVGVALPAWLLTFIGDFHDDVPDPTRIGAALAAIDVASGGALGVLLARRGKEGGGAPAVDPPAAP